MKESTQTYLIGGGLAVGAFLVWRFTGGRGKPTDPSAPGLSSYFSARIQNPTLTIPRRVTPPTDPNATNPALIQTCPQGQWVWRDPNGTQVSPCRATAPDPSWQQIGRQFYPYTPQVTYEET